MLGRRRLPGIPPGQIRINGTDTPWFDADVEALAGLPRLAGVRLPKAETPGSAIVPLANCLDVGYT
jgi:citrate lyase subunit beta/citryl-CoA lyase